MNEQHVEKEKIKDEDIEIIIEERNDPVILGALIASLLFNFFNIDVYIPKIGVYINMRLFMAIVSAPIVISIFLGMMPIYAKSKIDDYIQMLLPVGVFASIFNMQYNFYVGLIFLALTILAFVMSKIYQSSKSKLREKLNIIKQLRYPLCASIIVSLVLSFGYYFIVDKYTAPTVQPDSDIQEQDNSMVNHDIGYLKVFVDGSWESLNNEQKLDALQRIVNIESTYLGCDAMPLVADTLPDNEGGHYDATLGKIFVDYGLLEGNDAEKCIMTIIHEVRHRYQDEMVLAVNWDYKNAHKLRDLLKVNSWKNNYGNYTDAADGSEEEYFYQPLEYDAYSYSLSQTDLYFSLMRKYSGISDSEGDD